ncbi:sigma-54-dependent transcriptional regulator [Roseibacillus persicicus]|uniref:sigma-54-dependent transcriptional regulator n=1 Tax=Roseibacillus persicicus TaxID=454148 RepID=UPI00280EA917|nr:sigma-54 dependent transcriptional regulator [Roseibacillus persicicus]MDQ8189571.1 sigma-54 dependent transcriptional regulator [Roseibacillus persicicus]
MSADLIIVEDEDITRRLLELKAKDFGFRPVSFESAEEALGFINDEIKVILLDLRLPGMSGFGLLETLGKEHPGLPSVVLTAANKAEDAVKAMKLGAFDYLTKPFDPSELFECLRMATRLREVHRENDALRESIATPVTNDGFVAEAEVSKAMLGRAERVAVLDSTILLTGESGSGKGALARHIHGLSKRSEKPFVTVSCPALPRELLESELFGHEKGAFTGALKRRIGKIESARGGTLFLDEIGDLPLDLQPKLLNVLQDRRYQRVGSEEWLDSDFRLIAATNIDFEEKIESGEFREDLYYRLSVIPLELPPLRERPADIPPLVERSLSRISKQRGGAALKVESAAMKALTNFRWPGNVRQLENILERSSAFCEGQTIRLTDLPPSFRKQNEEKKQSNLPKGLAGLTLSQIEAEAIRQTLEACQGNKSEAARRLGIAEKTIYNKMSRHNIDIS